jgi:hypothetical protein
MSFILEHSTQLPIIKFVKTNFDVRCVPKPLIIKLFAYSSEQYFLYMVTVFVLCRYALISNLIAILTFISGACVVHFGGTSLSYNTKLNVGSQSFAVFFWCLILLSVRTSSDDALYSELSLRKIGIYLEFSVLSGRWGIFECPGIWTAGNSKSYVIIQSFRFPGVLSNYEMGAWYFSLIMSEILVILVTSVAHYISLWQLNGRYSVCENFEIGRAKNETICVSSLKCQTDEWSLRSWRDCLTIQSRMAA